MKKDTDFRLTNSEIEKLMEAGSLAPSGGNIQPWRVVIKDGKTVELMLDKKRAESFLDVGHLASYIALGAFLENMLITADFMGLCNLSTTLAPKNYYDPFLKVEFYGRKKPTKTHPLYMAIKSRVTNRNMHTGKYISESEIDTLKKLVVEMNSKVELHCIKSEKIKKELADILGKADGLRTFHKDLFKQMLDEIRWNRLDTQKSRDGIDIETLELPLMVKKMMKLMKDYPIVIKTFPKSVFEDQVKPLLIGSSHLCCLASKDDPTSTSMFNVGRVLESLWLTTTKDDLALHPWTVLPFFLIRAKFFNGIGFNNEEKKTVLDLGSKLSRLFNLSNEEIPVFIFRLSIAKPPSARSLRLQWKRFVEIR